MTFFVRSSWLLSTLCCPTVHFLLPIGAEFVSDGDGDNGSERLVALLTNVPLRCFSFFNMLTKIPEYDG